MDEQTAAVEATEEKKKSIVPAKYAGKYKGANDALAEFIKEQCSGKDGFEFTAFFTLCRKNGIAEDKVAHYEAQVAEKRHGSQGRARMTLRNMLATIARKEGKLVGLNDEEVAIEIAKPTLTGAAGCWTRCARPGGRTSSGTASRPTRSNAACGAVTCCAGRPRSCCRSWSPRARIPIRTSGGRPAKRRCSRSQSAPACRTSCSRWPLTDSGRAGCPPRCSALTSCAASWTCRTRGGRWAQSGSDIAPCNRHHIELAKRVREGIRTAGGIAIEFPTHPIQETSRRPTATLDRNLAYLTLVEILTGYFLDGVVLLTGCDKTTPACLMAAATVVCTVCKMHIMTDG